MRNFINANFSDTNIRYFNSREDFFSHKNDGSIDVVVMCNVFHEISPSEWPNLFSQQSLIIRALQNDGYMLLVEDQRIPVGEKAHKYGFIIPDTSHLRTLFKIKSEDNDNGRFSVNDARKNGRLKAHLISKSLLMQLTSETVKQSIDQLRQTAKDKIKHLRDENPTYSNGQLYGFWMQQFANATLFLD